MHSATSVQQLTLRFERDQRVAVDDRTRLRARGIIQLRYDDENSGCHRRMTTARGR